MTKYVINGSFNVASEDASTISDLAAAFTQIMEDSGKDLSAMVRFGYDYHNDKENAPVA